MQCRTRTLVSSPLCQIKCRMTGSPGLTLMYISPKFCAYRYHHFIKALVYHLLTEVYRIHFLSYTFLRVMECKTGLLFPSQRPIFSLARAHAMSSSSHRHFETSDHSAAYALYRSSPPPSLVEKVAAHVRSGSRALAVDVGKGIPRKGSLVEKCHL